MNQVAGSIMKLVRDRYPEAKYFTAKTPTSPDYPAFYFPPPTSVNSNPANQQARRKTYSLYVKFFHDSAQQAAAVADDIENLVASKRYVVPLVDETGAATGQVVRLNPVEVRMLDGGVAQIEFSWTQHIGYDDPPSAPAAATVQTNLTMGGNKIG